MMSAQSGNRGKYLTNDLPGVAGVVRSVPGDFWVEEILQFPPEGEGEHHYLWVEKTGLSTLAAVRTIGRMLNVPESALGFAGLKDARAITRQWVSVHLPGRDGERRISRAAKGFPRELRLLRSVRGRSKLRRGELRGNRFEIRIREVENNALSRACRILEVLEARGLPNAFGDQRFGSRGHTANVGAALILGKWSRAIDYLLGGVGDEGFYGLDEGERSWLREAAIRYRSGDFSGALGCYPPGWISERSVLSCLIQGGHPKKALNAIPRRERVLYGSAFQSAVFNECLARRMEKNHYDRILPGDVVVSHRNGKVRRIGDPGKEMDAWTRFEVSPAGQLLGEGTLDARGEPGEIENGVFQALGISSVAAASGLAGIGLRGGHRPFRVRLEELDLKEESGDLILRFFLPAGAYATEVLREVTKNDPPVGGVARLDVPFLTESFFASRGEEKA